MKPIFLLLYFGVCYLVLKIILKDEMAARFSEKKRILACLGGIGFVTLFFAPYILGLVESHQAIPAVFYSLPFFLIGASAFVLQLVNPQKAKEMTGFFIKMVAAVIGFLSLWPLIAGLWRW